MARPVTTRQMEILTAIVESYIANGEPVSSGTLAHTAFADSMSSATIRNEMAELADAGLLEQPHTSSGRVPSAEAFRLYVAQLSAYTPERAGIQSQRGASQREAIHIHIETSFAGLAGASALLERTSHVLAALSSGVGVAIGAATTADLLEHIHFSRLAERRVLAVVVTRGGMVRDRVLALDRDLASVQLETAANFLNQHFRGWNLDRVRAELTRRLEHERTAYQQLREAQVTLDAAALWSCTLPAGAPHPQTVFVDGVANLIGVSDNIERLRAILSALEEKQRLIELLNAYVDARQESVSVIFDLEQQDPGMAGLVLIAAPARVAPDSGDIPGTVAILGPRRMHYQNAIDAVGYVAQILHRRYTGEIAPPSP